MRMEGKAALVTGAASGIGRTTALLLAREGARVACVDRTADGPAEEIRAAGGEAIAIIADVTSEEDMERKAAATLAEFGRIDVLHANAGVGGSGSAHEVSRADWQRVIDVNLTGVWLTAKAVLPAMLRQGSGSIVNTASVGGMIGIPGLAAYAAAKAGVIGLTRQMAADYAGRGIRVNAICPGTTWTPLVEATYAGGGGAGAGTATLEEARARSVARYPLGRLGTTEEVAAYVLFLASDETAWTTGAVFVVDGGFTAV
jgi:NAD(P)-dependent dehydrogenase (short-subunit alcohol dehydrogenase family)